MKLYYITLSDAPGDPIKCRTTSKADARKQARLYIKQWGLNGVTILDVVEIKEA